MIADETSIRVAPQELVGQEVKARVLGHPRGPKVDVIRYRPKKRVRVHRGARADLTALEIIAIGAGKADKKPAKRTRSTTRPAEPAAPEEMQ